FGMSNPLAVSRVLGRKLLAMAAGETVEAGASAFGPHEACRQLQQVFDLYCQQASRAGCGMKLLADKAAGLPVFRNAGLGKYRNPEKQGRVAYQRHDYPKCKGAGSEGQVGGVQPLQAGKHFQWPAEQRQDQRIAPDQCASGERSEEHTSELQSRE